MSNWKSVLPCTILYPYSGEVVSIPLVAGTYKFRLWGASGGGLDLVKKGAKGAYSEGLFQTSKNITLYGFVGQEGKCDLSTIPRTKFGGGSNSIGKALMSCTGGGGSFIAKDNKLEDILIAAGAGGGSGNWEGEHLGGYGGPVGNDGSSNPEGIENKYYGKGAKYSSPGMGGVYIKDNITHSIAENGKPLHGGNANSSSSESQGSSGGGGSGYYGGGGGADCSGGGGGSSYASPLMKSVILNNGNTIFASPENKAEQGHTGDGYILIETAATHFLYVRERLNTCDEKKVGRFSLLSQGYFLMPRP